MAAIQLKPVDRVEILSVMDNSIDVLMGDTAVAKRHQRRRDAHLRPQLRAEHGVSMLVTTYQGNDKDAFLFDTGVTIDGVLHNMDVLEVKGNELHAVVLSHGHTDHTRGLMGFIKRYGRPKIPVVLHPDAYLKRKNIQPNGQESEHIPPSKKDMEAEDIQIIEEVGPTMLIGGHALVTGQIPRTTEYEKGSPKQVALIDGEWKPDPWIHDDQAIVMNVKDKGLVVLTGVRSRRGDQHAQARAHAHRSRTDSCGHRRLSSHRADFRTDYCAYRSGAERIQPERDCAAALHGLEGDTLDRARISRRVRAEQRRHDHGYWRMRRSEPLRKDALAVNPHRGQSDTWIWMKPLSIRSWFDTTLHASANRRN